MIWHECNFFCFFSIVTFIKKLINTRDIYKISTKAGTTQKQGIRPKNGKKNNRAAKQKGISPKKETTLPPCLISHPSPIVQNYIKRKALKLWENQNPRSNKEPALFKQKMITRSPLKHLLFLSFHKVQITAKNDSLHIILPGVGLKERYHAVNRSRILLGSTQLHPNS